VFGFSVAADVNRLTKTDPHRFGGIEPSKIFSPLAHTPGIGFHGHRDHRYFGPFNQLDPEVLNFLGSKRRFRVVCGNISTEIFFFSDISAMFSPKNTLKLYSSILKPTLLFIWSCIWYMCPWKNMVLAASKINFYRPLR
jgi:hypothetical protein